MSHPPRPRRKSSQLSSTLKTFHSEKAIWHLFGRSIQHAKDALASEKWQRKESRLRLLKKFPKCLRLRIEDLVKKATIYSEGLDSALRTAIGAAGFNPPTQRTIEGFRIVDLENARLSAGSGTLVFNLANIGGPGCRKWHEVEDSEWAEFISWEISHRVPHVTKDRHHGEGKPGLWNLYSRLTPWVAEVAAEKLELMGDWGKRYLKDVVIDLAGELSQELGVDVVGIAIHREKSSDLHVHLIFSQTREVPRPKKIPDRQFDAMISTLARQQISAGEKTKFKALRRKIREKMVAEGADQETVWELQRSGFQRPIKILGPSFTGKMALWEASGRNPAIAAQSDRPISESNTFRGRVVTALERGENLSETCLDVWINQRFTQKIESIFTDEERTRSLELAQRSVESYQKFGTANPSVEDHIAAEVAQMQRSLPTDVMEDFRKMSEVLEKREKAVAIREEAASRGLPIWWVELIEQLPKRFKRADPKKTMRLLVKATQVVIALREEIQLVTGRLTIMTTSGWVAFFRRMRSLLGEREQEQEVEIEPPT